MRQETFLCWVVPLLTDVNAQVDRTSFLSQSLAERGLCPTAFYTKRIRRDEGFIHCCSVRILENVLCYFVIAQDYTYKGRRTFGSKIRDVPQEGFRILPLLCWCWAQPGEQDQCLEQTGLCLGRASPALQGQPTPGKLQKHPAFSSHRNQWELFVFSRIRPSV